MAEHLSDSVDLLVVNFLLSGTDSQRGGAGMVESFEIEIFLMLMMHGYVCKAM